MSGEGLKPSVLVVDDTLDNLILINEVLKDTYKVRVATNGVKALEAVRYAAPDIILMDIMMPVMNGYEACSKLKEDPEFQDIPVLFLTAKSDVADEQRGFALGGADYIVKPVTPPILMARVKTHLALKQSRDVLEDENQFLEEEIERRMKDISVMQEASIMAMAALAETRDNETGSHLQRVKLYIKELAEHMAKNERYRNLLTPDKIKMLVLSSLLHDIGKIGIPDHILLKPGALTEQEYEIMRKHTVIGRDAILCAEAQIGNAETFLTCAREIAHSHHEKWDGTGYPQGLKGEQIPLPARLMAIADVYDAMTTKRIYKEPILHEKAIEIIKNDAAKHFDPDAVEAFMCIEKKIDEIRNKHADDTESLLVHIGTK